MVAPIAVQLYTLRDQIKNDLEGTITKVAEMGYIGAEPYGGLDAVAVKKVADQVGLQIMGSHVSMPVGDKKDEVLAMAATYEIDNIVIPSVPRDKFTSREGIMELVDLVNEAYENASAAGLKLGYHNHSFEFISIDDTNGYDIFVAGLNPNIFLELDTYWADNAGFSSLDLLQKYGSRTPFLHIKDGPGGDHHAPQFAVGEGMMDVPAIINSHDSEWLIVELDSCATDMLEAVHKSYTYLVSNGLARGNK